MCQVIEEYAQSRAEKIATNLLSTGLSLEEIAKCSELPLERVQELAGKRGA